MCVCLLSRIPSSHPVVVSQSVSQRSREDTQAYHVTKKETPTDDDGDEEKTMEEENGMEISLANTSSIIFIFQEYHRSAMDWYIPWDISGSFRATNPPQRWISLTYTYLWQSEKQQRPTDQKTRRRNLTKGIDTIESWVLKWVSNASADWIGFVIPLPWHCAHSHPVTQISTFLCDMKKTQRRSCFLKIFA